MLLQSPSGGQKLCGLQRSRAWLPATLSDRCSFKGQAQIRNSVAGPAVGRLLLSAWVQHSWHMGTKPESILSAHANPEHKYICHNIVVLLIFLGFPQKCLLARHAQTISHAQPRKSTAKCRQLCFIDSRPQRACLRTLWRFSGKGLLGTEDSWINLSMKTS